MPIPAYPANLIPRPFAANGTFQIIPDAKSASGRASWQEGFPVETQLPLTNGGIAPSRPDFNGIFNMLSALGYWQQAGGLMIFSQAQDYNTPAMVFCNGMLYFCKAPNGPDTTVGVVYPDGSIAPVGVDFKDYWISFLDFLASGGSGGGGSYGVPVGTVISGFWMVAPDGFFVCDGSEFSATDNPKLASFLGGNVTPDMRGLSVRGYDPTATRDPDGATRAIGSIQRDAGRNVWGQIDWQTNSHGPEEGSENSGALYNDRSAPDGCVPTISPSRGSHGLSIDASRCWGEEHTAEEFRGINMCLLYCIKHD